MKVRNSYHAIGERQVRLANAVNELLAVVVAASGTGGLVRQALASGWGACAWQTPRQATKDQQKQLAGPGKAAAAETVAQMLGVVQFTSASHTIGVSVALAGTSEIGPFGVDLIREFPERPGLARRIFSGAELAAFGRPPSWREVLTAAALKEAAYKAMALEEQRGVTPRQIRLIRGEGPEIVTAHLGDGPAFALAGSASGAEHFAALALAHLDVSVSTPLPRPASLTVS